jgi:hypothetical protein
MNPAYCVFAADGTFLASVVVNNTNPDYVNIAQLLKDNGPNLPVILGAQVAVKSANALDFSKPLGTNDTTTQWVVSSDLILNTPAWPDLTKKFGFKVVPLTLIGVLPANAFPTV